MRPTLAFMALVALVLALASTAFASPATRARTTARPRVTSKARVVKPAVRAMTLTRTQTFTRSVVVTPTVSVTRTTTQLSGCTAAPRRRDVVEERDELEARSEKPAEKIYGIGKPLVVDQALQEPERRDLEEHDESLQKRNFVWRIVNRTVVRTSTAPARTSTRTVTATSCTGRAPSTTSTPSLRPQPTSTALSSPTNAAFVPNQLGYHNEKRALHFTSSENTPALAWNATLAQFSLDYGLNCLPGHSNGPYGENLAWGAPPNAWTDQELFQLWYDESIGYDYNTNTFALVTGHFTQIVWKSTSQVGCAVVTCPGSDAMFGSTVPYKSLTCEYSQTRGNFQNQFVQNVLPPGQ